MPSFGSGGNARSVGYAKTNNVRPRRHDSFSGAPACVPLSPQEYSEKLDSDVKHATGTHTPSKTDGRRHRASHSIIDPIRECREPDSSYSWPHAVKSWGGGLPGHTLTCCIDLVALATFPAMRVGPGPVPQSPTV
ncbi:hypothetical protein CCM_08874 [Cordyceps militaris CM01]|uniref:Uncharacterized protein n=1 Tax=Cordyceps militaris (strain CM01) TaxID=983644 RepID=G3JSC9_CORMM|nr:uncharacterized protein CCM_08874 [Cordyceps militaris CM01]EGX88828.1 hypothetical protein CCM_08874 [Cordyceps militaris CM01]